MASATSTTPHQMRHASRSLIRSIGAKFAGRERGRDRKVHRDSYDVEDPRAQVFRPVADSRDGTLAWIDCLIQTAREFDLFERQLANRPNWRGPINPHGLRVLEELLRNHWFCFKTGRLDPAISQIMEKTGFARQTVVRALRRLKEHGFLNWIRRSEIVREKGEAGPQRVQTNNAYYFDHRRLPARVLQRFRDLLARKRAAKTPKSPAQPVPAINVTPAAKRAVDPELSSLLGGLRRSVESLSPPE